VDLHGLDRQRVDLADPAVREVGHLDRALAVAVVGDGLGEWSRVDVVHPDHETGEQGVDPGDEGVELLGAVVQTAGSLAEGMQFLGDRHRSFSG
jgi:hypothetical protein